MEDSFLAARKQLDELGYRECFPIECTPLIEKLIADLLQTTRSLQHYMNLSKEALLQRDNLKGAAEPYRCDNAKLVRENIKLHHSQIQLTEEHALHIKDTKAKIRKLENQLALMETENANLKSRCRQHELKSICADTISSRNKAVSGSTTSQLYGRPGTSKIALDSCTYMSANCQSCSEFLERYEHISKELNNYKDKNIDLSEDVLLLNRQLDNRNTEIVRLSKLLEGGRPLHAIEKDCCNKSSDRRLAELLEELEKAEMNNEYLNTKVNESVAKQHEAMNRAVSLADKNLLLEKELQSTDQMALRVESECNVLLKEKSNHIMKLKQQLESALAKLTILESEHLSVMESHKRCQPNQETNSKEIRKLKATLDSVSQVKENLLRENTSLLEANRQLEEIATQYAQSESILKMEMENRNKQKAKEGKGVRPHINNSEVINKIHKTRSKYTKTTNTCECNPTDIKNAMKDELLVLLEKERQRYEFEINNIKQKLSEQQKLDSRHSEELINELSFSKIKQERDFYYSEYNKIKKLHPSEEFTVELKNKICELEQVIQLLKTQNEVLHNSTQSLTSQLDQSKAHLQRHSQENLYDTENYARITITKLENDLKRAYNDIKNLEEERGLLQNRLKNASEAQFARQSNLFEKDFRYEALLQETKALSSARSVKENFIENLQQECDKLREKLKVSETDLLHTKTLHNQLKTLQIENDRNISESQAQIYERKKQINDLQSKMEHLERHTSDLENENRVLKSEKTNIKDNLMRIDQERDKLIMDIDDKTEQISSLQHQLRNKETNIKMLQNKTTELERKLELLTSGNTSLEHKFRDTQTRNEAVTLELDNITKQRDSALIENRRLQSDLATVNNDLRSINREYESSRKDVEEMKQQLQHYVDEVRRIEDILSRKEAERTDMLNHFASLSHEATVLESNNHSLETEAASKNAQLQETFEKLSDLERKLESRDALVEMQEEKMSSLMYKISLLESDLAQQKDANKMVEQNLAFAREMCVALEDQKKNILIGVGDTDSERKKLEYSLKMMTEEKFKLEETIAKDRATVDSLETLLSNSRREVVELKLSLQDALEESRSLKEKVESLQKKLDQEMGAGHHSRQRAQEAAKNLQELQWQMNDERFQRVRNAQSQQSSKAFFSGTL